MLDSDWLVFRSCDYSVYSVYKVVLLYKALNRRSERLTFHHSPAETGSAHWSHSAIGSRSLLSIWPSALWNTAYRTEWWSEEKTPVKRESVRERETDSWSHDWGGTVEPLWHKGVFIFLLSLHSFLVLLLFLSLSHSLFPCLLYYLLYFSSPFFFWNSPHSLHQFLSPSSTLCIPQ